VIARLRGWHPHLQLVLMAGGTLIGTLRYMAEDRHEDMARRSRIS
jgi:hypothetical protein